MHKRRSWTIVASLTVAALGLAACSGSSGSSEGATSSGAAVGTADAGANGIVNPSTEKGGTLRFGMSDDWDSMDTGNTYYGFAWNFARFYGRSLTMYEVAPGDQGATIVPDLAESLGTPSDDGRTWTYKIRQGVKYEDGTEVTTKDVKYAIARSLDKDVFPNGPTYFNDMLDLGDYAGPYKDNDPEMKAFTAIETPDDYTIIFKLKEPFAGFDYLAMMPQSMPVPAAKDTGSDYQSAIQSTGPYKFSRFEPGKGYSLVRNEQWDPATDPNRPALPDAIEVKVGMNADDVDAQLLSGDLDVDLAGSGVQQVAQTKIVADPKLRANADSPLNGRLWYVSINGNVAPLDNVACRKAVMWGIDRTTYHAAFGGQAAGDIPTNITPPVIKGAVPFDPYPTPENKGDVEKAKAALAECGQPDGFETNMAYRAERPKEKAAAEAVQQSLARVGIKVTLQGYPAGDYYSLNAGKPSFAKDNNLGLMSNGWMADWPDGFGFLSQIVDSRTIREAGGAANLSVRSETVDALVDKAMQATNDAERADIWNQVDQQVMEEAFIFPGQWSRGLLYRPTNLTNVFFSNGLGMYDYSAMGTTAQ